jgi:hypothetical protein
MTSLSIRILLIFMTTWLLTATSTLAAEGEQPLDQVTVKGTVLEGRVLGLVEKGIRFQTIYGQGELLIAYENIESLKTHGRYKIFYGKQEVSSGRLVGFEENQIVIETGESLLVQIPADTITIGTSKHEYDKSFYTRLKTRFPYTKASINLEWNYERGGNDKDKVGVGLDIERRKKPTRLMMNLDYRYEVNVVEENPTSTIKDEYVGFLLGEYDLSKRWYGFILPAVERDAVRGISLRTFPSTGVGYRFVETQSALLQLQTGLGYVFEEFEDDVNDNDYWASHFGLEGRYTLGSYMGYNILKGITFEIRLMYMPGLSDPDENWLLRSALGITIPLTDMLALKYRMMNVNDNNPSEGVGKNKMETSLGLSLGF